LDAVIGLPANLFHGTSIPVVILVLKSKRNGNSGNVLFIDASKEFIKGKNQNELSDEHISKIIEAYKNRQNIEKFAYVADIQKEIIEQNAYNLNIPRYVDTSEAEEEIDLEQVVDDIEDIDKEIADVSSTLKKSFDELGLRFPIER
jgi:type I restriction enzyme M protein